MFRSKRYVRINVIIAILAVAGLFVVISAKPVSAGANDCGVIGGTLSGDYAGLVIQTMWKYSGESDSAGRKATGGTAKVNVDTTGDHSTGGGGLINSSSAIAESLDFIPEDVSSTGTNCPGSSRGGVVLGYNSTTTAIGNGNNWRLDCDYSRRHSDYTSGYTAKESEGWYPYATKSNGTTSGTLSSIYETGRKTFGSENRDWDNVFQEFRVTPSGRPSGAPSGGSWAFLTQSSNITAPVGGTVRFNSSASVATIAAPNGATTVIVAMYIAPAPSGEPVTVNISTNNPSGMIGKFSFEISHHQLGAQVPSGSSCSISTHSRSVSTTTECKSGTTSSPSFAACGGAHAPTAYHGMGCDDGAWIRLTGHEDPDYQFTGITRTGSSNTASCTNSAPSGSANTRNCINVRSGSSARTINIRFNFEKIPEWNYIINWQNNLSPGEVDDTYSPKPGDDITIGSTVTNNGNMTGASYYYYIEPTSGGSALSSSSSYGRKTGSQYSGLGQGNSRNLNTGSNYTVKGSYSNAPSHNTQVCFNSYVTPVTGKSSGVTNSGTRNAGNDCVRVFNRRYDLNIAPSLTADDVVNIGDTIEYDYIICNSDSVTSNSNGHNSAASRGYADSVDSRVRLLRNGSVVGGTTERRTFDIGPNTSGYNATTPAGYSRTSQCVSSDTFTYTIPSDGTASIGDVYCVNALSNKEYGWSQSGSSAGSLNVTDTSSCTRVGEKPYLTVSDNSIWSGMFFCATDIDCSNSGDYSGDGLISGSRRGSRGAVVEFAAFALARISRFGSANRANSSNLTFSNAASPHGNLGAPAEVVDNLYQKLYNTSVQENPNMLEGTIGSSSSFGSGDEQRSINGNIRLGRSLPARASISVPGGSRTTLVINGNVRIERDIVYSGSYSGPNDIPQLTIIAKGNIIINPNVERIDGLFIAQGDGTAGGGGIITTCGISAGYSVIAPVSLTTSTCDEQLTINGSLVADKIYFKRTYGGVSGANPNGTNNPAEIINSYPELYIRQPYFEFINPGRDFKIQKIFDLPPLF